jgi:MFS family permease
MTGSVNVAMFIVSRFFAGAGAFMNIAAVPILMTEIVPVHLRGALVDIHAVFFVFGFAISGWVWIWVLLLGWRRQHLASTSCHSMFLPAVYADRSSLRPRKSKVAYDARL